MYWIYFLVLLGSATILIYGNPQLTSSIPSFSGELCPQTVTLTCNANLSDGIIIYFGSNNTVISSYIYEQDGSNVPVSVQSPNVTAQIAGTTMANGRFIFDNFTLSANLSDMTQFIGQEISCGTHTTHSDPIRISSYNISELPSIHERNFNTYYTVMYSPDGKIGTIHVESNYTSSSICDINISYSIEIISSNERKKCETIDPCMNDRCSANCIVLATNNFTIYDILVTATSSHIGENLTSSINLNSSIDVSLFFNSCDRSIMCPSMIDGNCEFMYTFDETFKHQVVQPNMTQQLNVKDSESIYYIFVTFHTNSSRTTIQLRYEVGRGNGIAVHFVVPGIIALVLGLLVCVTGLLVALTYIRKRRIKDHCWFQIGKVLGVIQVILFVLSLALWIAYFGHISTGDCGMQIRESSIAIAAMCTSFLLLFISPLMFSGFCFSDNADMTPKTSDYKFEFGKSSIGSGKARTKACTNSDCTNSLPRITKKFCHACGKYICDACARKNEAYIQRLHKTKEVCSKCIVEYNKENEQLLWGDSIKTISGIMSDGSKCWGCKGNKKMDEICAICNQKACGDHIYKHPSKKDKLCGKCYMLTIRKGHAEKNRTESTTM